MPRFVINHTATGHYVAWRWLTHNGHRKREQMSPADQEAYDSCGFTEAPPMTPAEQEEARRRYEALR